LKSLWLLLLWISILPALNPIEISSLDRISILGYCDKLHPKDGFVPLRSSHLNLGLHHQSVWLHCQIKNSRDDNLTYALSISSPLIEDITLIDKNQTIKMGMLVKNSMEHKTLSYYFPIVLISNQVQDYYIKMETLYTPLDFSIFLEEINNFLDHDKNAQLINIFLLGIIVALMLYAFILSFYIGDRSYLFYALYLLAVIYQQVTYLGLIQLYTPAWFVAFDAKITMGKISFLIVSSALFAMSFLETKIFKLLHWGYLLIILSSLLEVIFLNPKGSISLYLMILTGAIFILYNLVAGIIVYKKGKKEARLFIVGFTLVFFSYFLMIIDALGIASVMLYFRNLLIFTTAIEALVLSLAFADRYLILQKSKEKVDRLMLDEAKNRESIIQSEVIKKTQALNLALQEKELLMQEIHHRVKNNLQIILSMIRLQNDTVTDPQLKKIMFQLEMRINAIAKSYMNLITRNSLESVDMDRYLSSLLDDLVALYDSQHTIELNKSISVHLPFRKAVYIGLIINELISNSFKHAFQGEGIITIKLYREEQEEVVLEFRDNGQGFSEHLQSGSLGLMLIETLVVGQLQGSLTREQIEGTGYIIRFLG